MSIDVGTTILWPVGQAIARDWNTKDAASGYAGYVTRFRVRNDFLARYPLETAGARRHQEY